MDKHIEMLGKIKNRDDFIEFMRLYILKIHDSAVRDYLDSLVAWSEDMDGYYNNIGIEVPTDINWDFVATLLYVGSIYE